MTICHIWLLYYLLPIRIENFASQTILQKRGELHQKLLTMNCDFIQERKSTHDNLNNCDALEGGNTLFTLFTYSFLIFPAGSDGVQLHRTLATTNMKTH